MRLSLVAPTCALGLVLAVGGVAATVRTCLWTAAVMSLMLVGLRIWLSLTLPKQTKRSVAFFHPNAEGGGGGERVLWCAIAAMQEAWPQRPLAIYSSDGLTPQQLADSAFNSFSIRIKPDFKLVRLERASLLDSANYPTWTLARQAWGSARLGLEALQQFVPETWVDTSSWAFTYPLARLAGARVAAYTHYPTVSTDMLQRVQSGAAGYNNSAAIAASSLRSAAKLVYYYAFAAAYGVAGGCAQVSMANSSWTAEHVRQLFLSWAPPQRVYPPCDTADLAALPLERKLKRLYIVSLAQFRPEKDHSLQLRAFSRARRRALSFSSSTTSDAVLSARLKLIGSCRNAGDRARVDALRRLAQDLAVQDHVDFHVNAPWDEVRMLLGGAVGGLHTMVDEHFGISIVQYMAAGVVPIVHDSGGPREDILVNMDGLDAFGQPRRAGYLCRTESEYAEAITEVLGMDDETRRRLAAGARRSAARFSDQEFKAAFLDSLRPALQPRR